jgi:hypothetical protein
MDIELLSKLGNGSIALDGGKCYLRLTWGSSGQGLSDLLHPQISGICSISEV